MEINYIEIEGSGTGGGGGDSQINWKFPVMRVRAERCCWLT